MTKKLATQPVRPRILTINGGSSSIKFALFETGRLLRRVLEGQVEGIGSRNARLVVKGTIEAGKASRKIKAPDHAVAVNVLMDWLAGQMGWGELAAVGHRVVHGGPKYWNPQRITSAMVKELHQLS